MRSNQSRSARAVVFALLGAAAFALAGCPLIKPKIDQPVIETDPAKFIERVQRRAAAVTRMDARMEVNLKGAGGPYQGQFYGAFQMERRGDDLATWMQLYTVLGLPALEVVTIGERFLVFSPLDSTIYFNFPDLAPKEDVEPLPLASFHDIIAPLELIRAQLLVLYGLGFDSGRQYQLRFENDRYVLSESEGGRLRRELRYNMRGPDLEEVKIFEDGKENGTMTCSGNFSVPAAAAFVPSRLEVGQGAISVSLELSRLRINGQVPGAEIAFRKPKDERLILLTADPES